MSRLTPQRNKNTLRSSIEGWHESDRRWTFPNEISGRTLLLRVLAQRVDFTADALLAYRLGPAAAASRIDLRPSRNRFLPDPFGFRLGRSRHARTSAAGARWSSGSWPASAAAPIRRRSAWRTRLTTRSRLSWKHRQVEALAGRRLDVSESAAELRRLFHEKSAGLAAEADPAAVVVVDVTSARRDARCCLLLDPRSRAWGVAIPAQRCAGDAACGSAARAVFPAFPSNVAVAGSFQSRILSGGESPADAAAGGRIAPRDDDRPKGAAPARARVRAGGRAHRSSAADRAIVDDWRAALDQAMPRLSLI